jgi:hypothetical protein
VPVGPDADFVALGGTSLAAAQLVSLLRGRCPRLSITDLYQYPKLSALAARMAALDSADTGRRVVRPVPGISGLTQLVITVLLLSFTGLRWLTALGAINDILARLLGPQQWAPTVSWPLLVIGWLALISVPGRVLTTGLLVRALTSGIRTCSYRRGNHRRAGLPCAAWRTTAGTQPVARQSGQLLGLGLRRDQRRRPC